MPDGVIGAIVDWSARPARPPVAQRLRRAPRAAAADVEDLLVAMRLLRRRDGGLELAAVARRYAPAVVEPPAAPPALDFDEVTT